MMLGARALKKLIIVILSLNYFNLIRDKYMMTHMWNLTGRSMKSLKFDWSKFDLSLNYFNLPRDKIDDI